MIEDLHFVIKNYWEDTSPGVDTNLYFSQGHNSKQFLLAVYDEQSRVSNFSNYVSCVPNYMTYFVNKFSVT